MEKKLGKHPETGEEIVLGHGRYGPFIQCGDGLAAKIVGTGWWPPAAIDLTMALKLLQASRNRAARKARPPRWLRNFHREDFLQADQEFRLCVCSDRERLVSTIVNIGARERVDDSDADRFALAHFDSRIADTHPGWWHAICAPMSDEQLLNFFKGLVICERENDWGICSPTPTAKVFHILRARMPHSQSGELRNWPLRNRGRNPYTPTGGAIDG